MIKKLVFAPMALGTLFLFAGCAEDPSTENQNQYPKVSGDEELVSHAGLQATEAGKPIDAHHRIWYGIRLLERPADATGEHDFTLDAYTPENYAAARSEANGAPDKEGIHFIVKNENKIWLSCATAPEPDLDESWCYLPVPPICYDNACLYEFHISKEPFPHGIDDTNDWDANPDGWISTTFDWEEEFGSALSFTANYKQDIVKYTGDAPGIELTIEGDTAHTRGWIRRVKEDLGVIIEPRVPATR